MTKVQTAKRQMAEAVAAFFLQHPEILQESVLLSETVDELKQQLLMLTANLSIQTRSLKGDTVSKHAMAGTMTDLTDRYGKTLISLFWKRKLVSEKTQSEAILSNMKSAISGNTANYVKGLCDLGLNTDEADLQKAGLSHAKFTALRDMATTYEVFVNGLRLTTGEHVQATANIALLTDQFMETIRMGIGGFMEPFADSHPDVYALFQKVKTVEYPANRRRRTDGEGEATTAIVTYRFTDEATAEPIEGATLAIDGVVLNDTSDDNGEVYLDDLAPGTHTVAVSAPGYLSRQWTTIAFEAGKDYDFEEMLTHEATA